MTDYAIVINGVNKYFHIGSGDKTSALVRCLNFLSGKERLEKILVINNIDIKIKPGEVVGVIGGNGSGKSTILRLIADIYQPDSGEVKTEGKVIYLTGFGYGLMPRLTMRENIYLIGAFLGLSKFEIDDKIDEIVEFSELKKYFNTKVFKFSSGMISRLSFATTMLCVKHHQADIILIDEALDVGADLRFQSKAISKMESMIKGGTTVLIASHNLEMIKKYCAETIWLEGGAIIRRGPSEVVISEYINNASHG